MDFREIPCWELLLKYVEQVQIRLKENKNNVRTFMTISCLLRGAYKKYSWRSTNNTVPHTAGQICCGATYRPIDVVFVLLRHVPTQLRI